MSDLKAEDSLIDVVYMLDLSEKLMRQAFEGVNRDTINWGKVVDLAASPVNRIPLMLIDAFGFLNKS